MFAKIQISLSPGQQDNSNALPPSQSNRSNPRLCPASPPTALTLIGAQTATDLTYSSGAEEKFPGIEDLISVAL